MKLKITEQMILTAKPGSPYECPIACALKELDPKTEWFVGFCAVVGSRGMRDYVYHMPPEGQDFVKDYDRGIMPEPMELEFDGPDIMDWPGADVSTTIGLEDSEHGGG